MSSNSQVRATVESESKCSFESEVAVNFNSGFKPKDLKYAAVKIKVSLPEKKERNCSNTEIQPFKDICHKRQVCKPKTDECTLLHKTFD